MWRLDQKSYGGGVEVVSLFLGFRHGFVHGFPAFGSNLGGIWVVGFRFVGCGFSRWVGGFVPMGLMVGFSVCWVCLVVGFDEDDDDDDGFTMNRDSDGRPFLSPSLPMRIDGFGFGENRWV